VPPATNIYTTRRVCTTSNALAVLEEGNTEGGFAVLEEGHTEGGSVTVEEGHTEGGSAVLEEGHTEGGSGIVEEGHTEGGSSSSSSSSQNNRDSTAPAPASRYISTYISYPNPGLHYLERALHRKPQDGAAHPSAATYIYLSIDLSIYAIKRNKEKDVNMIHPGKREGCQHDPPPHQARVSHLERVRVNPNPNPSVFI